MKKLIDELLKEGVYKTLTERYNFNEEDVNEVMDDKFDEALQTFDSGSFEKRLDSLTEYMYDEVQDFLSNDTEVCEWEEEEDNTEERIEEVCESLHVGFNFVPGIGAGFCSNEKDLEDLKNFVRGGMTVRSMFGSL